MWLWFQVCLFQTNVTLEWIPKVFTDDVNIGSGNGLESSGIKPLCITRATVDPELYRHMASLWYNGFMWLHDPVRSQYCPCEDRSCCRNLCFRHHYNDEGMLSIVCETRCHANIYYGLSLLYQLGAYKFSRVGHFEEVFEGWKIVRVWIWFCLGGWKSFGVEPINLPSSLGHDKIRSTLHIEPWCGG